jgi:hypothetical protein
MNLYAASVAVLWTTALRASGVGPAEPIARQSTGSVPRAQEFINDTQGQCTRYRGLRRGRCLYAILG